MTLHKLKVAALQHEQREDWAAAIELYRQAIREAEGSAEGGDPSLYNRIGDLALKAGDQAAACEAWEQAVNRYSDLGFFNSAVALCGKILRVDPNRVQTYLELARLHARKRVLYDVQLNLQLYLKQMTVAGRGDAARAAVERLGNEFPGFRDLDTMIDQLLGREGVAEAPAAAPTPVGSAAPAEARGGLVFLDTGPIQIERASDPQVDSSVPTGSLIEGIEVEQIPDALPVEGFEPTRADDSEIPPGQIEGLVGTANYARDLPALPRVEGLDAPPTFDAPAGSVVEGLESTSAAGPGAPTDEAAVGGDLIFLSTEGDEPGGEGAPAPTDTASQPDDPMGDRLSGHALLEGGDRPAAIAALEQSLGSYESQGEWLHAYHVASELVEAEPTSINRHQARVEMASRLGDVQLLGEAYADLGDTLGRQGSTEKAVAVYRRILELDDNNVRARAALRAMAPASTAPATPDGFIDLGAELIDDHPTSMRMRTEMPAVAPDEQDTFREALAEFKRALDLNLPIEDHQAHYDLGIAFKEMGLLDEAISEFQKALREPEVRLRTSEALGETFVEQGRPAVAEAVLRGVENGAEGDAEKIGVLYWLGRSLEAQGRQSDAVRYYQRIIAVDVAFRDASARMSAPPGDHHG